MPAKLLTSGGGGVILQPASSIASDVTVNVPSRAGNIAMDGPAFSARATTNQTISSSTWTKVTLGTELFDTDSCFASSRFTPNVAGYYQISGQVSVYGNTTAFAAAFYKNGTSDNQFYLGYDTGASARSAGISGSYVVYLNGSTDYIELYGYQVSGTTVQFEAGGSSFACKMSGSLVRAA